MSQFNVLILVPGYLRSVQKVASAADNQPVMGWNRENTLQPWQTHMCRWLGMDGITGEYLPAAHLSHPRADFPDGLTCADPVHLRAGRDTATLLPSESIDIQEAEAIALFDTLNTFLVDDGLAFIRQGTSRWYLRGRSGQGLRSFPPSFLANRPVSSYLPHGDGVAQWVRLQAELQMLLHDHPVNVARVNQGKLPINSVWFWGGADVPDVAASASELASFKVYADETFALELSAHCGVQCEPLDSFNPENCTGDVLIVDTRIVQGHFVLDNNAVHLAQQRIDDQWLPRLHSRVDKKTLHTVKLINEEGDKGVIDDAFINNTRPSKRKLLQQHIRRLWVSIRDIDQKQ